MTGLPRWLVAVFFFAGIILGGGTAWLLWRPADSRAEIAPADPAASIIPLTPAPAPIVGAPAPDFTLPGIDGTSVRLSDLAGTPVVINFWATWCEPCREELPNLDDAAGRNVGGLRVLAVESAEPEADIAAFLKSLPLDHVTILLDGTGSVRDQYLVLGYPTTVFVDSAGMIRAKKVGTYDASALADSLRLLGVKP
jgi:cytochrome c biogenesis protein CcmG, thiol:disulfide interchange protein DsbE